MRALTARRPTMKQSCGKMAGKIRQYLVGGGIIILGYNINYQTNGDGI